MVIDQRNNGASVSVTSTPTYYLDRYLSTEDTDGTLSVQQVSDAPAGFTKSIKFTVGTADASLGATQYAYFRQAIEGLNFADMAFGTASAATVTVSFWVKVSVAGLYSGNIASSNHDRCNAFSFTVLAANTWEQKSVTIAGDTTGTWLTTNGAGAYLHFCLCSGSTYLQSSTGVWQAGTFLGATGTTNLMATAGATFQVTGVQLEKGSTATAFDYRPYGTELSLCQRYFAKTFPQSVAVAQNSGNFGALYGLGQVNGVAFNVIWKYPVTMRTSPTITTYSPNAATANWSANPSSPTASVPVASEDFAGISANTATLAGNGYYIHASASAEL